MLDLTNPLHDLRELVANGWNYEDAVLYAAQEYSVPLDDLREAWSHQDDCPFA